MNSLLLASALTLGLVASGTQAQQSSAQRTRTLDLAGRVVTVPSPLVVDSRQMDPVATPLRFDATHFAAIDRAQRINIAGFPLDRTTRIDLELENFDVYADDAVIVRGSSQGDVPSERAPLATLRGSVVGIPGSKVYLAISPLMSNGIVEIDGTTHIISNGSFAQQTGITVYNLTDLPEGQINWLEYACTLVDVPGQEFVNRGDPDPDPEPDQPCRIARVAIETDFEFSRLFMTTDPEAAEVLSNAYIETLVGGISQIYTDTWNMRLRIAYQRVWPNEADPDPWVGTDTPTALGEMNALWTEFSAPYAGEWHGAHLLSGKPLGGGIAYLATICQLDFAQAVSGNLNGSFPDPITSNLDQNWDLIVTAHEWGHNFGAPHTHGLLPPEDQCGFGNCAQSATGTIMSYCHLCPGGYTNIALVFGDRILNETILPYVTLIMPCNLGNVTENECAGDGTIDCPADVNGDGQLLPNDFTAWIVAYNANDLAADCNRNGTVEAADFSAWIASWIAGCDE